MFTLFLFKMKKTAIKVGEDLLMRINRLKYAWGYKTQEQVLRHLIELKTPKLNPTKSHQQNPSTTTLFTNSSDDSKGGANNNHRANPEVKGERTRCEDSPVENKEEK